ncbi:MAG: hypothetical protein U1F09_15955 [Steroidobacteraceae bacterium]
MSDDASKLQILLARLVIVLMVGLVAVGVVLHGVSGPVFVRIWQNILARPFGPMTFRFILQPVMATLAALRDGVRDARLGRAPYLWTILSDPEKRGGRLREGLIATARVLLLGLVMDVTYQLLVFDEFHPAEAVIVAVLLAFMPYLLLRGVIARIARRRMAGAGAMPDGFQS